MLPVTARVPLLATLFAAAIGLVLDPCYLCVTHVCISICVSVCVYVCANNQQPTHITTRGNVCTMKPFQLFLLALLGYSEFGSGVCLLLTRNFSPHFEIGVCTRQSDINSFDESLELYTQTYTLKIICLILRLLYP